MKSIGLINGHCDLVSSLSNLERVASGTRQHDSHDDDPFTDKPLVLMRNAFGVHAIKQESPSTEARVSARSTARTSVGATSVAMLFALLRWQKFIQDEIHGPHLDAVSAAKVPTSSNGRKNMSLERNDVVDDESKRDLALLQGAWEQTRLEADGVVNPVDDHGAPGALTTFAGSHFSVRTIDGSLLLEAAFVLDASTRPKSITWIDSIGEDNGRPLPASYVLGGDHFEFIAGNEGASRPTEFRTVEGQTMRTCVRRR